MKRRTPAICTDERSASPTIKRTKVQAQRKFAQGCNNYTYSSTKITSKPSEPCQFPTHQPPQEINVPKHDEYELNNFSNVPTIDDFLTFLCFRETEVLPDRLNYLNRPLLNVLPAKKKSMKSINAVCIDNCLNKNEQNRPSKINNKSKSGLKSKTIPEYKLRSRNMKKQTIMSKSSHFLALKHNQRLRSKSVVQAKFSENKLQNLKQKIPGSNGLVSHSIKTIKLGFKSLKNRPLTRAFDKTVFMEPKTDLINFKRITRRNSSLDKNSILDKKSVINKSSTPKEKLTLENMRFCSQKSISKSLRISLPKFKSNVTNTTSAKSSLKPITRSVTCGSAVQELTQNINSRPSRKTKEAAALYMEMLGKDLLCPEESCDDDDNTSIDSFPELPNREEHIRREKEFKEMHQKKAVEKTLRRISVPKSKPFLKSVTCKSSKSIKDIYKNVNEKHMEVDVKDEHPKITSGLCTRSKQYNIEPKQPIRKEQSVKIIRTRMKSRNSNFARRNSFNDFFDKSKHLNTVFNEELNRCKIENKINIDDRKSSSQDKKTDVLEAVTIKKLSTKCNEEKGRTINSKKNYRFKSRIENTSITKKNTNLVLPRRSSEPVIIEKIEGKNICDLKTKKSFTLKMMESKESFKRNTRENDDKLSLIDVVKKEINSSKPIVEKSRQKQIENSESEVSKIDNSVTTEQISNDKFTNSKCTTCAINTGEDKEISAKNTEIKPKKSLITENRKISECIKDNSEVKCIKLRHTGKDNNKELSKSSVIKSTSSLELEIIKEPKKIEQKSILSNEKCCETVDVSSTNDYKILKKIITNKKIAKKSETVRRLLQKNPSSADELKEISQGLEKKSVVETSNSNNVSQESKINSSENTINKVRKKNIPIESLSHNDKECALKKEKDDFLKYPEDEECEILVEVNNENFVFTASDDSLISNTENEKISECSDTLHSSKQDVVTSTKNSDFKKPTKQRMIFSNSKTLTTNKPTIQTTVSSNNKKFNLKSKKIIFKKDISTSVIPKQETGTCETKAFSPENENSVYAFEPDLPTTSPPFRSVKTVSSPKSIISNSIAVQVNFENDAKLELPNTEETQVSSTTDCGDRVFYIPIQTSTSTSTLGVAVKLGTDGPNQKIIMSATLITNSSSFTTSTSTSVSTKTTCIETTCTQSDTIKLSSMEQINKKPSSSKSKDNIEKISPLDIQVPCSSTSTSPKIQKKSLSVKTNPQSVKIVKLNKNKKSKHIKPEIIKSKPRSAKAKNVKKPVHNTQTKIEKVSSIPTGEILDAPTFYPTIEEFNDPLEYINTIRSVAEKYGLCRIVPPPNFRPECKVADEMRFTAYNQYIHKMLHRWGPNVKEMMAIKKFLTTQNITFTHPPWIGGMEVDLPRLYQVVQQCGGLKAVIEKERWHQVADIMRIPKLAQDRIAKLDDIYCKYLLPYDILSHGEREQLFEEIEKEWIIHLKDPTDDEIFDDIDECIVKGRTMPLSCFYRIARNTMLMCFNNTQDQEGPTTEKIEEEFWNHVSKRKSHICVHSGSIDSGTQGYGFSTAKNSTFRKHPWNLKVLTNNSASILRSLGPVMGVTVPTLHVGMLYSACCWYRDPHGLPWIEYLHTGANKIWYGIPDEYSEQFKEALLLLVPRYCRDKKIWLPSDTLMIPPPLLTSQNISLSRVVQHPGQFIVVFPKSFTSSISTGYHVSESVYFAHSTWLNSAKQIFKDMQDSCEPSVFSLEQLLISIAEDARSSLQIHNKVLPLLIELKDTEVALRKQLKELGLNSCEKLNINKKRKSKGAFNEEDNYECETCRANLFISLVINSHEQSNYCLKHAAMLLSKKPTQVKYCKLMYAYTEDELQILIEKVKNRIEVKSNKKSHAK